jgi:hypothetical protein
MANEDNFIIKGSKKLMITDEIIIQAIQDIFRDEIKETLRKKLKENPRLEKELKDAIRDYTRSKLLEASAQGKLLKVVAELGMISLPDSFKDELVSAILKAVGPEIDVLLKNTL